MLNPNQIRNYGIEKCHMKHLTLGCIVFAYMTPRTPNLNLMEAHNTNLIRKYEIAKCHINHLPLSIYSLCMYL